MKVSNRHMGSVADGKIVAALGLPGAGKSSVMQALARKINADVLLEPEENEWGEAVHTWDRCGHFTGLMWFRSARVPLLYEAQARCALGRIVLLDSYYDKALYSYLGQPGMEWLLAPDDPYFPVAREVARLDWARLPDADCIVVFEVTLEDWRVMLEMRNRMLDRDELFRRSFETQSYFIKAAERLSAERNMKYIHFHQRLGSIESAAERLLVELRAHEILP